MDAQDVDGRILANCRLRWQKVAKVIYLAREQSGLPDDDASYDLVADRLNSLIESGKLEAVGNIDNRRRSEVRLMQPEGDPSRE